MISAIRRRYLDVLASVYLYNEHRGYSSLDRVLEAVQLRQPDAATFIAEVKKHRRDERHHYLMFKNYFKRIGIRPFALDRTVGHIDRMIKICFGCPIDDLDTRAVAADIYLFSKLCRVIMLTEQRGMWQVDTLLKSPLVCSDTLLVSIFKIVERDEPSHWMPYERWLMAHSHADPIWRERIADKWVHANLILFRIPLLFLNPWLKRMEVWQDDGEPILASHQVSSQARLTQPSSG